MPNIYIFIISLLLLSTFPHIYTNLSSAKMKNLGSCTTNIDVAKYSNICIQALMSSLNPNICIKDDDDIKGYTPIKLCPKDTLEENGNCYVACINGFKLKRGLCFEDCGNNVEKGDACIVKGKLIPKKSYFATSVPYDSNTICKSGYFKFQDKCYRDCGALGLYNCGTSACTKDSQTCTTNLKDIINKISDKLFLALQAITKCDAKANDLLTLKANIQAELGPITFDYLKTSFDNSLKLLTGENKKDIFDQAVIKLFKNFKNILNPFSKLGFLTSFCSTIYDYLLCNTKKNELIKDDNILNTLDVMFLNQKNSKCKESCNGGVSCAENIFPKLKTKNANGILALGAGLYFDTCDFCMDCETSEYSFNPPKLPFEIKNNCVYLFENSNYGGNYLEKCEETASITSLNAMSLITGSNVKIVAYNNINFKNNFFGIGNNQYVPSLTSGEYDFMGLKYTSLNSFRYNKDNCLHIIQGKRTNISDYPSNYSVTSFCLGDSSSIFPIYLNSTYNYFFFKSFSLTQKWKIYDYYSSKTYIINGQSFFEDLIDIGFNYIKKIDFL